MLSYYYYDFLVPDDYEKRGFARIAHLRSVDPRHLLDHPHCKSYRKKSSRMNAKIHIFIIIIPIIFWFSFFCIYLTPQLLFFLYIFVPMTPQATLLSEFFVCQKMQNLYWTVRFYNDFLNKEKKKRFISNFFRGF